MKVTAKVLGAVKGPKIRIGKYKKRTGYRRHTGFRASLTQIEIESIGGAKRSRRRRTSRRPSQGRWQRARRSEAAAPAAEPEPRRTG